MYYPDEWNYKQTLNNGGSYSVAGFIRTVTGTNVDSEYISITIPYRVHERFTLPSGIIHTLIDFNINPKPQNLALLSEESKVQFLKNKLKSGKPIIVLGGNGLRSIYRHYILIVGFSRFENEMGGWKFDGTFTILTFQKMIGIKR